MNKYERLLEIVTIIYAIFLAILVFGTQLIIEEQKEIINAAGITAEALADGKEILRFYELAFIFSIISLGVTICAMGLFYYNKTHLKLINIISYIASCLLGIVVVILAIYSCFLEGLFIEDVIGNIILLGIICFIIVGLILSLKKKA